MLKVEDRIKMENKTQLPRIAYFCMEYGLHPQLPIYAGGLGILAGDYMKAAHDLGVPMVGIGILWRQDYTEQFIDDNGRPYDVYPNFDYDFIKDTGVTVELRIRGVDVTCKVRYVDQYGNAPLYLLDTNFPGSDNGWMTNRLYGGTGQDRIAQEMILGIGGMKALRALGIKVDEYHFNEGHAVFAGLELIREKMALGFSFRDAWEATREQIIFTTHTPVAAGNEQHEHALLQHMEAYNSLSYEQVSEIGGNPFNMTVAALKLSHIANAVSKLHGDTARKMWRGVAGSAPIISITNGVHINTWQSEGMRNAFEQNTDLWQPHQVAKQMLIDYIAQHTGAKLNPNVLLIGFARRAAAYKRSELIFRNAEVIEPLLRDDKVQLVFSGKAHPNDEAGKDIIQELVRMDKKYGEKVVFLENYNMEIAKLMIQGCDVWLNNPRRPLEASGTSGMKAAINGVLNLSIMDGWVPEGPQHGISGFLIKHSDNADGTKQDEIEMQALYGTLLEEVIPTYYNGKEHWLDMMRASIDMSRWQFSSHRMLREYYDVLYIPTLRAQQHAILEATPIFQHQAHQVSHEIQYQ